MKRHRYLNRTVFVVLITQFYFDLFIKVMSHQDQNTIQKFSHALIFCFQLKDITLKTLLAIFSAALGRLIITVRTVNCSCFYLTFQQQSENNVTLSDMALKVTWLQTCHDFVTDLSELCHFLISRSLPNRICFLALSNRVAANIYEQNILVHDNIREHIFQHRICP